MGNLIRFDSRRRLIPEHPPLKGEGEVLIFTGVRYERTKDTPPDSLSSKVAKPPQRRKRKRS